MQAEFSQSGNRSLSTWSSSSDTVMLDAIHLATCVSLGSMFHYPFLRDSGSNSFEIFIRTQVAYQLSSKLSGFETSVRTQVSVKLTVAVIVWRRLLGHSISYADSGSNSLETSVRTQVS